MLFLRFNFCTSPSTYLLGNGSKTLTREFNFEEKFGVERRCMLKKDASIKANAVIGPRLGKSSRECERRKSSRVAFSQ